MVVEMISKKKMGNVIDLLSYRAYENVLHDEMDFYDSPMQGKAILCILIGGYKYNGASNETIMEECGEELVKYFPFVMEKRLFNFDGHPDKESEEAEEILLAILAKDGAPFIEAAREEHKEEARALHEMVQKYDEEENPDWITFYKSICERIKAVLEIDKEDI
nr:hypothetical protein [Sicyoidochytrium minutum DNA virus]